MLDVQGNTPYDGRYVFIRLRYNTGFGGFGGRRGGGPQWSHDYPRGEVHFTKILNEITYIRARADGSNILSLDDPELFKFPIAYMAEPGFWSMTDKEVESFRAYLKKGGFVIFDDFRDPPRGTGTTCRRRCAASCPTRTGSKSTTGSILYGTRSSRSTIQRRWRRRPTYDQSMVLTYWGIFEDNDPRKRLIAIANVNGDLSEYLGVFRHRFRARLS